MFDLLLKRFGPASAPMSPSSAVGVACRTREKANTASLARVSELLHSCSSDLERLGSFYGVAGGRPTPDCNAFYDVEGVIGVLQHPEKRFQVAE
jgi:hypothetical protein